MKKTLKDRALGKHQVEKIANLFSITWDTFSYKKFISVMNQDFDEAGILQRVRLISIAIIDQLPSDFSSVSQILLSTLKLSLKPTSLFGDFIYAPFSDVVVLLGCTSEHLDVSLELLRDMTIYFSSEFALRPFLLEFPDRTFEFAEEWTYDSKEQVRRLASEGTRPFLPWASQIHLPLKQRVQILNRLKNDKSEFVLRSVGNHLDDIAKKEPMQVVNILANWKLSNWKQSSAKIILQQATRHLLRSGDKKVFPLLGIRVNPALVSFSASLSTYKAKIGTPLVLNIIGETNKNEKLYIDMELRYPSAISGKVNKRVFKLRTFDIEACKVFSFRRSIKTTSTSTRRYRPGLYTLAIRVNGNVYQTLEFSLTH